MARGSKHSAMIAVTYLSLVLIPSMALQACGDDHAHDHGDHDHDEPVGPPSGAVCPDDSTLTYENFGQMFMEDYCTRCHSSELEGDARMDAPDGHDFDTIEGIWAVQDHIDQMAASGPDKTNMAMPLGNPKPTLEERELLGEWLACEAPEN
jgi:uncharacterized membrane protein